MNRYTVVIGTKEGSEHRISQTVTANSMQDAIRLVNRELKSDLEIKSITLHRNPVEQLFDRTKAEMETR